MRIKGLIFDFDGTLFDSMSIWENAGEKYLRSLNIKAESDLHKIIRNFSMKQTAVFLRDNYNIDLTSEEIVAGINKTVESFYMYEASPKQGVVGFLERLKKNGISMCVATVTERRLIEAALSRCGMCHFFNAIVTCDEVGHGKDEPFIYRKAMEYLDSSYKDTVVFEDALYAIRTAKNDGFVTVGVFDQSETNQDELKLFSDFFIEDYFNTEEVLNYILN